MPKQPLDHPTPQPLNYQSPIENYDLDGGQSYVGCAGFFFGALITVPALLVSILFLFNQEEAAARWCFPWTMLLAMRSTGVGIDFLLLTAIVQFPIYGLIVGWCARGPRNLCIAILILLSLHVGVILFCFEA